MPWSRRLSDFRLWWLRTASTKKRSKKESRFRGNAFSGFQVVWTSLSPVHIEDQPVSRGERGSANVQILTPTKDSALRIESVKNYSNDEFKQTDKTRRVEK